VKKPTASEGSHSIALPKKRILIVDDHAIMREGLVEIINRTPELEVCGQTGDAFAALDLAATTQPDLAVVDINIAGKHGLELIKDLHVQHPEISILALSAHDETLYAERVLRAGGSGYVMKSDGSERLITAIRQVLAGETAVSAKVSAKVLDLLAGKRTDISPVEKLTDRELEVFQLIGQGKDNTRVASQLRISPKTAEVHRTRIKEKLEIKSTGELISFAARWIERLGPK
jgi:DNA-binding NarL/FixJ family response regulator